MLESRRLLFPLSINIEEIRGHSMDADRNSHPDPNVRSICSAKIHGTRKIVLAAAVFISLDVATNIDYCWSQQATLILGDCNL